MTCRHNYGDPECTAGKSPKALVKHAIRDLKNYGGYISPADIQLNLNQYLPENFQIAINEMLEASRKIATAQKLSSVDSCNYEIVDIHDATPKYLVLRVKYPSCSECEYESVKTLVFENVTLIQALKWRKIDPHFRAGIASEDAEVPSPVARFHGSDAGYKEAIEYIQYKMGKNPHFGVR